MTVAARATILVLLAACGGGGGGEESRVPNAAEVVGTYDLTATFRGASEPRLGVATLSYGTELRLDLSTPLVALHGTPRPDGTVMLVGNTTGSDAINPVSGRGKIDVRGGVYRFVGFVTGPAGDADVVLERPVGTDARAASGEYRMVFTPSPGGGRDVVGILEVVAIFDAGGNAAIVDTARWTPGADWWRS